MKTLAILISAALMAAPATATEAVEDTPVSRWQADHAQIFDASEALLEDFLWIARPIVVFADTEADPRFRLQIELLNEGLDELAERDVVIIVDTDPRAMSPARKKLRPRGFMLVLIAKDGTVMLRKPFPWDVRELSRSIDKLPLREQEIRDQHLSFE